MGWSIEKQRQIETTWDGKEISSDPPFGSTIVVHRFVGYKDDLFILILHRAHKGPDYEGDWAWTPPAGARQPGETIEECAERELAEETGLTLPIEPTNCGDAEWYVYIAEATEQCKVILVDEEHDRYEWVSPEEALRRCAPEQVKIPLKCAIEHIIEMRKEI